MKNTHRSHIFDELLRKKVRITFKDGSTAEGVLPYKEWRGDKPDFIKPQHYYLSNDNCDIVFSKSSVKEIEKL